MHGFSLYGKYFFRRVCGDWLTGYGDVAISKREDYVSDSMTRMRVTGTSWRRTASCVRTDRAPRYGSAPSASADRPGRRRGAASISRIHHRGLSIHLSTPDGGCRGSARTRRCRPGNGRSSGTGARAAGMPRRRASTSAASRRARPTMSRNSCLFDSVVSVRSVQGRSTGISRSTCRLYRALFP